VPRYWNYLAANPGHLSWRPAEGPRISERQRKHSRTLWDNKKLRAKRRTAYGAPRWVEEISSGAGNPQTQG